MKFICTSIITAFLLCSGSSKQALAAHPQRAKSAVRSSRKAPKLAIHSPDVPASLEHLASTADNAGMWPELRHYAATRRSPEEKALAYFVLGYQEYQSGKFPAAEEDLAAIAPADFPLADLAEYYQASAAYKGGRLEQAISILEKFSACFPNSIERYNALQLLAEGYLQNGEPADARDLLTKSPEVRERPELSLLLAQAYLDAGELPSAAQAYQEIYYAFPMAPESQAAKDVLDKLRLQMGASFPSVSDEIASARVERLYKAARYDQALDGYNQLLSERPGSTFVWRWNVGKGECLVRLRRADEAIDTLNRSIPPNPESDAERQATLVAAYVQTQNDTAIAGALNKLQGESLTSPWHAAALESAGNYFMQKGDLEIARSYYEILVRLFPKSQRAGEASWRLAWMSYLGGAPEEAEKAFLDLLNNYPGSAHTSAALYYLARLKEENHPAEARSLYELLSKRYVHGYYGLQAAHRLPLLAEAPGRTTLVSAEEPDVPAVDFAAKIPAADPPLISPCLPSVASPQLRTFQILEALHLDDLAKQDLEARLALEPSAPDLLLAASKLAAAEGHSDRALHVVKKIYPDYHSQPFSGLPREFWDLLYPRDFLQLIRRYAASNHLDPYLVMALIRQESGFNPQALSYANARGLMQIVPATVTKSRRYQRVAARRLYSATYNLQHGCAYLRMLLKNFDGNVAEALAAYNAGPSRVNEWLSGHSYRSPEEFVESIPFGETRVYVKAVFTDSAIYRQLMNRPVDFAECPNPAPAAHRRPGAIGHRRAKSRT